MPLDKKLQNFARRCVAVEGLRMLFSTVTPDGIIGAEGPSARFTAAQGVEADPDEE